MFFFQNDTNHRKMGREHGSSATAVIIGRNIWCRYWNFSWSKVTKSFEVTKFSTNFFSRLFSSHKNKADYLFNFLCRSIRVRLIIYYHHHHYMKKLFILIYLYYHRVFSGWSHRGHCWCGNCSEETSKEERLHWSSCLWKWWGGSVSNAW